MSGDHCSKIHRRRSFYLPFTFISNLTVRFIYTLSKPLSLIAASIKVCLNYSLTVIVIAINRNDRYRPQVGWAASTPPRGEEASARRSKSETVVL